MEDIQKQLLIAKGTAIGKNFSEKTVTRTPFTLDDIKEVTDMCQLSTAAAGAREWNSKHPDRPIHENTVLKYVNHFKTYKTYFQPETRGPKHLLSHDQEDILVAVLKQWRANGNAIIATLVSAIAAGLFSPYKNGREKVNGLFEFSVTWARDFMGRHGFRVRRATTDRTVDAETVVKEGKIFFDELQKLQRENVPPELCFNFDEFFACFGENNRWTWERVSVGEKRNIVIKTEKAGFTGSVLCSADGTFHLLQAIFKGKTNAVHVHELLNHEKLLQQHNEDTHFQNSDSFSVWLDRFVKIVDNIREAKMLQGRKALLILDQAPQHVLDPTLLQSNNIEVVLVPKKCTHVFQPCDQFVIAGLKQLARKMWYEAITEAYRVEGNVEDITNQVLSSRTKFRRKNKLEALIKAACNIPAPQIRKSWEASGVLRALFGIAEGKTPIVYDAYKEEYEGGKVVVVEESEDEEEDSGEVAEVEAPTEESRPTKARRVEIPANIPESLVKEGWILCTGPTDRLALMTSIAKRGRPPKSEVEELIEKRKEAHRKKPKSQPTILSGMGRINDRRKCQDID